MRLIEGDLWASEAKVKLVTTNATLDRRGHLVMGAGAALQAKLRYPHLPKVFGVQIAPLQPYGLLLHQEADGILGAFQTKNHWRDNASLELIALSVFKLRGHMVGRGHLTYALNFPGIGHGGLDPEEVLTLLEDLPDQVGVYHQGLKR